ncbi:MAG: diguanylate cyclase, partial [Actinobacteria bacterium]
FMRGAAGRLEAILHDGELSFESAARRRNGQQFPTEVSTKRVDSPGGPLIVAIIRDISDSKAAQAQLTHLAFHDGLTGLSNRAAFDERLRIATADARRHGDLLGLAYLDLDRFKPVNDQFGHETGDAVLIAVSQRLFASVREQDVVARLGGDEFVVLLPRLHSVDELDCVAERLLSEVRRPIEACGNDCVVDASIGFAVYDPEHDDPRSLVVKADVAMYAAKRDPEHPWLLWNDSMGTTS